MAIFTILGAIGTAMGSAGAATATGSAVTAASTGISAASAASAVSAAVSAGLQVKSANEQKDAEVASNAVRSAEDVKRRLSMVREAKLASAAMRAQSVNQGTEESSGAAGGMSSIGTQSAANQAFLTSTGRNRQLAAGRQVSAARYSMFAGMVSGLNDQYQDYSEF